MAGLPESDAQLLRAFVADGSEASFAEIVKPVSLSGLCVKTCQGPVTRRQKNKSFCSERAGHFRKVVEVLPAHFRCLFQLNPDQPRIIIDRKDHAILIGKRRSNLS